MRHNIKKHHQIIIGAVAVVIIIVIICVARSGGWTSYTEKDTGLSFSYPKDWQMRDALSTSSPCCLFVVKDNRQTATTTNEKGETVITTTGRDIVRIQFGSYNKLQFDPFGAGTTTKTHIGKNDWYVGSTTEMTYYLLPKDDQTGIGAAIFFSLDEKVSDADADTAHKIIESVKVVR